MGVQLVSIQTSPCDRSLWAVDNRGAVFVRTGLSEEMPVGTEWEHVPGNTHLATPELITVPVQSGPTVVRFRSGLTVSRFSLV